MGGVTGFDLVAALMLGEALGIPKYLSAEFLPEIEAAAVFAIRDQSNGGEGD